MLYLPWRVFMTKADLIPHLATTLEADPMQFSASTVLSDLPHWDSMRLLEVIVLMDEQLGVNLNADQLSKCQTAGQILDLIEDKLSA
jgi:acyl carrier protein